MVLPYLNLSFNLENQLTAAQKNSMNAVQDKTNELKDSIHDVDFEETFCMSTVFHGFHFVYRKQPMANVCRASFLRYGLFTYISLSEMMKLAYLGSEKTIFTSKSDGRVTVSFYVHRCLRLPLKITELANLH